MSKSRFNLPIPFGWYAIAQSSELQSSEVKPLSYFDRALTLFRTSTGQARVIDAMCPHLGANLSYGTVVENSVMCPFHGWKFDGDGFCTDVPYAKRMPPKVDGKKCMTSYHTREINSMIWAWYHPDDIDPLYELDPVAELNGGNWAEPTVYEWEVAAPIQETGENAVDTAHFAYVHTAESVPEAEVIVDGFCRETRMFSKVKGINEDGSRTEDYVGTVELASYNFGPGQTVQRIGGSFDTVLMGTITPIDADNTHMRFVFANAKEQTEDSKVMHEAFQKVTTEQVEQDMAIWNTKFYNPNPILCDGDGPIALYRKWFTQFYQRETNTAS